MSLIMSNQKAHRRLQLKILATTFAFVFLLIISIFLAQQFPKITWLKPFAWFIGVVYIVGLLWSSYYFSRQVIYLCPVCHKTFQPSYWDFSKAGHTPKTRKLTCSSLSYEVFLSRISQRGVVKKIVKKPFPQWKGLFMRFRMVIC